jgi:hypothetical protein
MQITNIFKKKEQKENQQLSQNQPSKTPYVVRDNKGRFIGKKKEEKLKKETKEEKPEIISVTFYGKEVRKIYSNGKWYFNIEDIYNLSWQKSEKEPVTTSENYEKIKKEISQKFGEGDYATAEGIKKLVNEVNGIFPGPLTRWLDESSQLEYVQESPQI